MTSTQIFLKIFPLEGLTLEQPMARAHAVHEREKDTYTYVMMIDPPTLT